MGKAAPAAPRALPSWRRPPEAAPCSCFVAVESHTLRACFPAMPHPEGQRLHPPGTRRNRGLSRPPGVTLSPVPVLKPTHPPTSRGEGCSAQRGLLRTTHVAEKRGRRVSKGSLGRSPLLGGAVGGGWPIIDGALPSKLCPSFHPNSSLTLGAEGFLGVNSSFTESLFTEHLGYAARAARYQCTDVSETSPD